MGEHHGQRAATFATGIAKGSSSTVRFAVCVSLEQVFAFGVTHVLGSMDERVLLTEEAVYTCLLKTANHMDPEPVHLLQFTQ